MITLEIADVVVLGVLAAATGYFLYARLVPSLRPACRLRPASPSPKQEDKSMVGRLLAARKDILILYGSQTGTAEEYAARLVKEAARFGLACLTADPEEFDMAELENVPEDKLVVLVVATYGEGEPTDNAVGLHEYLSNGAREHQDSSDDRDSLPLHNLHYSVFGLGNKTYEHYNLVARNFDKWCSTMGATRVGERGEGDDDANMEDDFQQWNDGIWKDICKFFNIDSAKAAENSAATRTYALKEYTDADITDKGQIYAGQLGDRKIVSTTTLPTYDIKNPFCASVCVMRELFSHDALDIVPGGNVKRNCIHAEIDISGSQLNYQAGDHIAIWPTNSKESVEKLARALNLLPSSDSNDKVRLDAVFSMTAIDTASRKRHPFPCPTTYRSAFTNYLDITVPPRQHHLRSFMPYVTDPDAKVYFNKLLESKEFYHSEIMSNYISVGDLLTLYPMPDIPLDVILESFVRIQPRYYSISSSPKEYTNIVHVTAIVVRYYTPGGKLVKGLTTNYLYEIFEQMQSHPELKIKVPIYIRHSNFKLPRQNTVPLIMIGPGTGVAPFRGFAQERCAIVKRLAQNSTTTSDTTPTSQLGKAILFFGCRHRTQDFLYASEWDTYITRGGLSKLMTAFSREGPKKVYVQHLLEENKQEIWEMVSQNGGYIYVCGDAKSMARDVNKWFVDKTVELGGMSEDEAIKFVKNMRNKGKYLEDVWA